MKQPTQQPGNLALSPRNIRRLVTERGSLRGQLLRGVIGNGGVNGLSMLLRLLVSVVLARLIGAEGLGAYTFAIAIVGVVAIPVQLGFPQFVVRHCAIYMRRGDTALMKGLLYSVGLIVLGVAVLALVASIPLVEYLVREDGVVASATLLWAFALLPWSGLSAIGSSALRSLHYQIKHPQGKLVRVTRGEVFDVAVALRPDSPTFGQWVGDHLSEENNRTLWVPPGFSHAFLVTASETAEFQYKCADFYAPEHERAVHWADKELAVTWPIAASVKPIVSQKDGQAVPFAQAEKYEQEGARPWA